MNADDEEHEEAAPAFERSPESRHRAREAALQMLYQWEVGRADLDEVLHGYWAIDRPGQAPVPETLRPFADGLVVGTVRHLDEIDPLIAGQAQNWRLSRMAIIDRLILRLAVYEFLHAQETPRKVVINEALELAKTFSADDAVKFVNGILDGIKRELEKASPESP